jgi:hypothetical protein
MKTDEANIKFPTTELPLTRKQKRFLKKVERRKDRIKLRDAKRGGYVAPVLFVGERTYDAAIKMNELYKKENCE